MEHVHCHHAKQSLTKTSAHATLHCLTGCVIGETVGLAIGVMEVVMNGVDYMVGGVQAASLASPIFYVGLAAAIPAGFLAAWPVNYWLLKREIKGKCH